MSERTDVSKDITSCPVAVRFTHDDGAIYPLVYAVGTVDYVRTQLRTSGYKDPSIGERMGRALRVLVEPLSEMENHTIETYCAKGEHPVSVDVAAVRDAASRYRSTGISQKVPAVDGRHASP